jgi:hypothetical protein
MGIADPGADVTVDRLVITPHKLVKLLLLAVLAGSDQIGI